MHRPIADMGWRRLASWILGAVLLVLLVFYAGRAVITRDRGPVRLVIYAFSTQEEVLTQGIFPAFEQVWEAREGRDLSIEAVFGASGILAGQINLGAPADVALLSNEQHVTWLKIGRRVRPESRAVVVSATPMVIAVRPGNPAHISEFADLARPGLKLLHPDPRVSGAGDWAVLAEYGSALMETGDQVAARTQLMAIWDNVRLLTPSARATLTLFELGAGDALVTYEQDARLALDRAVPLEIVVPPRTIVARHVTIIVDANVTRAERPAAEAFIRFLLSDAGQRTFAEYHLRPAYAECDAFPPLVEPFSVDELGGWSRAYSDLIENLWQTEIAPRLELEPAPRLPDTIGE
ncbi:MAG: sulfate ABC transporter substrate-binding protein [Anaerolineae bacterium]